MHHTIRTTGVHQMVYSWVPLCGTCSEGTPLNVSFKGVGGVILIPHISLMIRMEPFWGPSGAIWDPF